MLSEVRKSAPAKLRALDAVVDLVGAEIAPSRVTYNKGHVALGTAGRNLCWLHPSRSAAHCHARLRTSADEREAQIAAFEDTGMYVRAFQRELIELKLAVRDMDAHSEQLVALLRRCAALSSGQD